MVLIFWFSLSLCQVLCQKNQKLDNQLFMLFKEFNNDFI